MTRNILILLASTAAAPTFAQTAPAPPAGAEPTAATAPADEPEDDAIVIVGQRERATVIGDIPPENQLTGRDIRATGATSITEVLAALAPQIGSARGRGAGQPVLLLNGQRISSFRELRDIPPEAIERVDILPEEVALKYGYRADQRVVNFVLRRRFNSTTVRADAGAATDGGYVSGLADATRFTIAGDTRTTVNLHAEANGAIDEDERDIALTANPVDQRGFRSLVGERRLVRGNLTATRTVFGDVGLTVNGEAEHTEGKSGLGFNAIPLLRDTSTTSAHLGFSLNATKGKWRLSSTGNADASHTATDSDRSSILTDKARSTRTALAVDATASGPWFKLPAGDASATFKLAADTLTLDSGPSLRRNRGDGSANLDLPILKNSPIGKLTANANAELEQLSDFGSLTTYGAGLNWAPRDRLSLIVSWTREEGAPTIEQLGDPLITTANARVFDFTTGQTVNVTATTGGNAALNADRRSVVKLGANFQPFEKTDLRLRADYVRAIIDSPISSLPGPSAALEAAFRDRFIRDGDNNLVSVDLRPVNFDQSRRETIRWGFDFTTPLKSAAPSPAQIAQFRSRFAPPGGAPPQGQAGAQGQRPEGAGRGPGGGGRGFGGGGGFGGADRGRLQLSLTHTVTLVDQATIRAGLPKLDYLDGAASGQAGGTPRHQLEMQAGWSNNGFGARLSGNWRSGTRVDGGTNGDLKFSPLTTVNLRLFANLGERFDLVAKHPWLIGSSVRLEVDNLFNARPKVRDGLGGVPSSYQSDLLDPTGRTVLISFRKAFLPQRFRARSSESSTTR